MLKNEKYCAFIADIVDSTKMETHKRHNVQDKLQMAVDEYNIKYEASIAAKLYFSSGDQLQALFINAHDAYKFACDFREKMYPIQFRIGLGIGDWSLCFPGDNTNKQDGTSYHRARKAYEHVKKHNKNIVVNSERDIDAYINALIAQEYAIFESQSQKQKEVFAEYKIMYPICPIIKKESDIASIYVDKGSQKAIAEKVGTSRQNINKHVQAGSIYGQRDLQGAIILFLNDIF